MADILIIDDDKDMSFTLCRMVEHMGHTYSAAYTLRDGLQKASVGEFDVVLLDVRLPDGNGLGIIPELQPSRSPWMIFALLLVEHINIGSRKKDAPHQLRCIVPVLSAIARK